MVRLRRTIYNIPLKLVDVWKRESFCRKVNVHVSTWKNEDWFRQCSCITLTDHTPVTFIHYDISKKGKLCSASGSEVIFKYWPTWLIVYLLSFASIRKSEATYVDLNCKNSSYWLFYQNPITSLAFPSSISLHCAVSLATVSMMFMSSHPACSLSSCTVLLQVFLGLPTALLPSGLHPNATMQSLDLSLRSISPIQVPPIYWSILSKLLSCGYVGFNFLRWFPRNIRAIMADQEIKLPRKPHGMVIHVFWIPWVKKNLSRFKLSSWPHERNWTWSYTYFSKTDVSC